MKISVIVFVSLLFLYLGAVLKCFFDRIFMVFRRKNFQPQSIFEILCPNETGIGHCMFDGLVRIVLYGTLLVLQFSGPLAKLFV